MSRRSKIAIIVALLILALILLILWLLSLQQAAPVGEPVLDEAGGTISKPLGGQLDTSYGAYVNTNKQPPQPSQPTDTTPPAPPDNRSNLKRLAAAFAERYGSFSNNSDYENLLDLKAFMTASMAANTDTYVEDARAKGSASAEYYGMITRSISTEVTALDETAGTAVVIVTTQRHSSGTLGEKIYYQGIDVKFVKAGDTWQVSAAAWQPAQ